MSNDTHAAVMAEAKKILEELKECLKETIWTRAPAPQGAEEGWEFWQGQVPNRMAFTVVGNPTTRQYEGSVVKGSTVVRMTAEVAEAVFATRPDK